MPGYSGTPLSKKLGFQPGMRTYVHNAPAEYEQWISPLPDDVQFVNGRKISLDFVHLFTTERIELETLLDQFQTRIKPNGIIWVSWPKKASKRPTDITEDVIRQVALPMGLVDIKVCAVSEIWSGLKLVIRKELRQT